MSKKSDNDYIIEDLEFEIKKLRDTVADKDAQLGQLKQIIKDNDLEDELEEGACISDEERICLRGIYHLAKLFEEGSFTKDDATTYDILHKNLRLIRGQVSDLKTKKTKPKSKAELLSIVTGNK